ncbi:hypothetical protein IMSAG250_00834 [Clostridiales bacterium]|nr:DUF421 domain-containing protein [Eubacterium sp.]MDE6752805.1 DUF421 domain-containing protein [Eubacterium sp.]GFI71627.1 hypothetical protein IMSAG250_00834 [Clostridiales bacterium]
MSITLIRAVIIYITVITAMRIMGKRQIGELKPHELVITVLVSQVASIPLEDNSMPLANMFVPILIFVSFEIIVSVISMKSLNFRNLIQGRPMFVIRNGKIDEKQMKRLRFTIDDLIDAIRQKDVFDISTVQDAVIETNGSISVLQKAEEAPVTPKQLKLSVDENSTPIAVVIDGKPVTEYFSTEKIKNSKIELVVNNENKDIKDIMLLTIDEDGNTYLIPKRGN